MAGDGAAFFGWLKNVFWRLAAETAIFTKRKQEKSKFQRAIAFFGSLAGWKFWLQKQDNQPKQVKK